MEKTWECVKMANRTSPLHKDTGHPQCPFFKGCLGVYPYRNNEDTTEFTLDDPYCHRVSYEYNPLYDPNLRLWFYSGNNLKFLYRQGLIDENLRVICKVKEYKEYERFLSRKHNELVMRQEREKELVEHERRKISKAFKNHLNRLATVCKHLENHLTQEKRSRRKKVSHTKKKEKIPVPKEECNSNNGQLVKHKEIKSYTVYGRDKCGKLNLMDYKGTFIKGSPDEFILYGNTDRFFNGPKNKKPNDKKQKSS